MGNIDRTKLRTCLEHPHLLPSFVLSYKDSQVQQRRWSTLRFQSSCGKLFVFTSQEGIVFGDLY